MHHDSTTYSLTIQIPDSPGLPRSKKGGGLFNAAAGNSPGLISKKSGFNQVDSPGLKPHKKVLNQTFTSEMNSANVMA